MAGTGSPVVAGTARSALVRRLSRYTVGSGVAFATSELALVLCFATGLLGAAAASVVAFAAGAVPNYVLNRHWVWRRDDPAPVRRELGPYLVVSAVSLGAAAAATSAAAAIAPGGRSEASIFVAVAYLASYGVLFFAKFVALHRFVFAPVAGQVGTRPQEALRQSRNDGLTP
jgi:putative flippase GtrA